MIPVFALGRAQELLLILGEAVFWVVLLGSLVKLNSTKCRLLCFSTYVAEVL